VITTHLQVVTAYWTCQANPEIRLHQECPLLRLALGILGKTCLSSKGLAMPPLTSLLALAGLVGFALLETAFAILA
jgi:hypothetical protein